MIYIKDLVVAGKHGLHAREKSQAQRFRVSVELDVDTDRAQLSDDMADTVDWSWLRDTIVDVVQNNSFTLVERLAQAIADQLLADKRIKKVVVAVDKMDAFESGMPGVKLEAAQDIK